MPDEIGLVLHQQVHLMAEGQYSALGTHGEGSGV